MRTTCLSKLEFCLFRRSHQRTTRWARNLLQRSIEIDPGFAAAHAWLAHSHHYAWLYGGERPDPHRALARAAARRAVSLDEQNADAHWSLSLDGREYVKALS